MTTLEDEIAEYIENCVEEEIITEDLKCARCGYDQFELVHPNDLLCITKEEEDGEVYYNVSFSDFHYYEPTIRCAKCKWKRRNKYDLLEELEILISEMFTDYTLSYNDILKSLQDMVLLYE